MKVSSGEAGWKDGEYDKRIRAGPIAIVKLIIR